MAPHHSQTRHRHGSVAGRSPRIRAVVRPFLLLSCCLAGLLPAQRPADAPLIAGERGALLDAAVQRAAPQFWGAVVVAAHGEVLLAKGYGFADGRQLPNGPRTLFDVGGLTHQFAVAAVLRLQLDKRLSLDQPIARHLKQWTGDKALTVQQLLAQQATLPKDVDWSGAAATTRRGAVQAIARGSNPAAGFSPQADHLLAALVEEVSGQHFEDFVERRLLQPAGMDDSGFVGDRKLDKQRQSRRGGDAGKPVAEADYDWAQRGASGLCSTGLDLHAWVAALVSGRLLPLEAQAPLWSPVGGDGAYTAAARPLGGLSLYEFTGSADGYRLRMLVHRESQSWVILWGGAEARLEALQQVLAAALAMGGAMAAPTPAPTPASAAAPVAVGSAEAGRFAGTFELPVGGSFVIAPGDGGLWLCGEGLQASARVVFGLWPPASEAKLRRCDDLGQKHLQALRQQDGAGIAAGFAGDDPAVRARNLLTNLTAAHGEVQRVVCVGTELTTPVVTWFALECARDRVLLRGTWADDRRLASLALATTPHPFRAALSPLRTDVMQARLASGRTLVLSIEGSAGERTLVYEDATPGPAGLLDCREVR